MNSSIARATNRLSQLPPVVSFDSTSPEDSTVVFSASAPRTDAQAHETTQRMSDLHQHPIWHFDRYARLITPQGKDLARRLTRADEAIYQDMVMMSYIQGRNDGFGCICTQSTREHPNYRNLETRQSSNGLPQTSQEGSHTTRIADRSHWFNMPKVSQPSCPDDHREAVHAHLKNAPESRVTENHPTNSNRSEDHGEVLHAHAKNEPESRVIENHPTGRRFESSNPGEFSDNDSIINETCEFLKHVDSTCKRIIEKQTKYKEDMKEYKRFMNLREKDKAWKRNIQKPKDLLPNPRFFIAQFQENCADCSGRIERGDPIWQHHVNGYWSHLFCDMHVADEFYCKKVLKTSLEQVLIEQRTASNASKHSASSTASASNGTPSETFQDSAVDPSNTQPDDNRMVFPISAAATPVDVKSIPIKPNRTLSANCVKSSDQVQFVDHTKVKYFNNTSSHSQRTATNASNPSASSSASASNDTPSNTLKDSAGDPSNTQTDDNRKVFPRPATATPVHVKSTPMKPNHTFSAPRAQSSYTGSSTKVIYLDDTSPRSSADVIYLDDTSSSSSAYVPCSPAKGIFLNVRPPRSSADIVYLDGTSPRSSAGVIYLDGTSEHTEEEKHGQVNGQCKFNYCRGNYKLDKSPLTLKQPPETLAHETTQTSAATKANLMR